MKKTALAFASLVVSIFLALGGLKLYEVSRGADIENAFVCEPRPAMWVEDAILGYRNRPGFHHKAFGNIVGVVNRAGFRSGREFSRRKKRGTFRIAGVGDSVMWGTRVNAEDSFLGRLERLLAPGHEDLEVINAAVIGYSTVQELLLLRDHVIHYAPDLVLVNFCSNDILPTEDPFGNARGVCLRYLDDLRARRASLTGFEQGVLADLTRLLKTSRHVWKRLETYLLAHRDDGHVEAALKLLVCLPIRQMHRLVRSHGGRLVYVFVPNRCPRLIERRVALFVQRFLAENRIEFVDTFDELVDVQAVLEGRLEPLDASGRGGVAGWLRSLLPEGSFPAVVLANVARWHALERLHARCCYTDNVHPSRKGNQLIARRVHDYLQARGRWRKD